MLQLQMCCLMNVLVCLFVCVHAGRGQGRCIKQGAAEHQATTGGDRGGETTTGGGDGPGITCTLFISSALTNHTPRWLISSVISAVNALYIVEFSFVITHLDLCNSLCGNSVSPVKLANGLHCSAIRLKCTSNNTLLKSVLVMDPIKCITRWLY